MTAMSDNGIDSGRRDSMVAKRKTGRRRPVESTVTVAPEMLRWAQERSGRSLESIHKKFPKLKEWETGETHPTFKKLEEFAAFTYVQGPILLLSSPPIEEMPLPDFRTIGDITRSQPSPNLLETIYACQQRQAWYRDYVVDRGDEPVDFVGAAILDDDALTVAA